VERHATHVIGRRVHMGLSGVMLGGVGVVRAGTLWVKDHLACRAVGVRCGRHVGGGDVGRRVGMSSVHRGCSKDAVAS